MFVKYISFYTSDDCFSFPLPTDAYNHKMAPDKVYLYKLYLWFLPFFTCWSIQLCFVCRNLYMNNVFEMHVP